MQYKGYTGVATIDPEAGVIHGTVANLRAVVTFQGESVREAERAFRDSVDDYLDFCRERGVEPEKPYSGKFMVRIAPELHRDVAAAAARQRVSLNELVGRALSRLVSNSSRNPAGAALVKVEKGMTAVHREKGSKGATTVRGKSEKEVPTK